MEIIGIVLGILLIVNIILVTWGNRITGMLLRGVYSNQEVIYGKVLETQITSLCMYIRQLQESHQDALEDERYEDAAYINDTLQFNTKTLKRLRDEYEVTLKNQEGDR